MAIELFILFVDFLASNELLFAPYGVLGSGFFAPALFLSVAPVVFLSATAAFFARGGILDFESLA
jgi:hypothetical protein